MNINENFEMFYQYARQSLSEKTSMQALKTEEILQVMQIASTLTLAYEIKGVKEVLQS